MGASVQPQQVDPRDLARIQANVASMRAQGAPESDVLAYLQHEDSQQPISASTAAPASTPPLSNPTDINTRNLLRSAAQGATLGFAGKFGAVDSDAQKAFQQAHPFADFAGKAVGGIAAPVLAALAAPEAAAGLGAGGLMALAGGQGAIMGANEADGGLKDRALAAAEGGALGAGTAGLLHGGGKLLGMGGGALVRKLAPEWAARRAVGAAARGLLDDPAAVQAHMDEVNALAPGGSSPASAAVAPFTENPRLLSVARIVGAGTDAGRAAEAATVAQRAALDAGRQRIGAQIDALDQQVPITPALRAALNKARAILGGSRVEVPPTGLLSVAPPPGFQPTALAGIPPVQRTIATQELRNALSDLRVKMRSLDVQGIDANGVTKHATGEAHDELKGIVYNHVPGYKPLDVNYAKLADETRALDQLSPTVERSRQNEGGHIAAGTSSSSLGSSITATPHIADAVITKLLANKAAGADAVTRYVLAPTDANAVRSLLKLAPQKMSPRVRGLLHAAATTGGALPSSLRGLLTMQDAAP